MSFSFSPYLSQILTKLLETLISLQEIKISIYLCNAHEVILFLFGTINFTTKDRSQLVWTSFFCVVDQLGLVFKGPVAVPEYLKWSRLVAVASCLVLREKTGLNWTQKHWILFTYSQWNWGSSYFSDQARQTGTMRTTTNWKTQQWIYSPQGQTAWH